MTILLSPAKQMDFSTPIPGISEKNSAPFEKDAAMLNRILQNYSREELASLMKLSPALADQTYLRIREFAISTAVRRPAVFAYSGMAFLALNPRSLSTDQCRFAQQHLKILSGIYGILQPLNEICPYRLEMNTPIKVPGGNSLPSFWKPRVMEYLISGLNSREGMAPVLNLASDEYSRVIDKQALKGRLFNFHFKEKNGAELRTVGTYAKTARGLMVRRILVEQVVDPHTLREGDTGGYRFDESLSYETDWVFVRNGK